MEKEVRFWSAFFIFLGAALLFTFRKVFTGNFVLERFNEYKSFIGLSFYFGMVFFIFGFVLFLFFYSRDKKKRR